VSADVASTIHQSVKRHPMTWRASISPYLQVLHLRARRRHVGAAGHLGGARFLHPRRHLRRAVGLDGYCSPRHRMGGHFGCTSTFVCCGTIVVGSDEDDDHGSGSDYVFTRDIAGSATSRWMQRAKLVPPAWRLIQEPRVQKRLMMKWRAISVSVSPYHVVFQRVLRRKELRVGGRVGLLQLCDALVGLTAGPDTPMPPL